MRFKKHVLLITIMFISACSSDSIDSFAVSTNIDISLKDTNNTDLLNPANENSINSRDIKVYQEIDGKKMEAIEINRIYMEKGHFILQYPQDFFIFQNENEYRIRVFLQSNPAPGEYGATYINWGGIAEDTIKYKLIRTESSLTASETQYNDFVLPVNVARTFNKILNK